jgi:hypothetical protein|tara:strand:- start:835 stop:1164 length:330 start_codon:yes stop_codon:yes gene_type:complete
MGDNDFPAVMANGNGNSFLSGYMKKRGFYGEQGTDIPGGSVSYQSEQSLGEPLMEQMQIAGSPGYMPSDRERSEKVIEYYRGTPKGILLQQSINKLKQKYGNVFSPPSI